jgi:type I restriction enzyme, S subunit
MSQLPLGWAYSTLGELATYVTSGSRDWSRYYSDRGALFVRTENINTNRLAPEEDIARVALPPSIEGKRTLILRDDLLITITGANVGKCAHVDRDVPEAYVSQSVALVRLRDKSLARFLHKQLIAPGPDGERTLLQQSAYGLGRPVLNLDNVRGVPLKIAPAPEQKRIADKLDGMLARVDACRERLDRVRGILKRFRQSVLAAATSGELTREWREERGLDESSFDRRVPLGGLCTESFYGPRFGKDEYNSGGIPTIRTTDMTRGGRIKVTSDTPRVMVPKDKLKQFAIRKGDLLVTRTGSIGVMAVFDDEYVAVPSAYLIRFRFRPEVLPRFVFFCLMAPYGQELLGLSTTAVTQPNINAEAIKRIEIPVPSLQEQSEMIRRVDELLAGADLVEARLRSGKQLVPRVVPAMLGKAFRGELFPQDPNDEPASKLLAGLRTRLSSTGDTGKRKRGGTRGSRTKAKADTDMLTRKDVSPTHLTVILKERGALTAEALWTASQLDIDDFYDQLKDEEARGLLRENRGDAPGAPRLLEPAA